MCLSDSMAGAALQAQRTTFLSVSSLWVQDYIKSLLSFGYVMPTLRQLPYWWVNLVSAAVQRFNCARSVFPQMLFSVFYLCAVALLQNGVNFLTWLNLLYFYHPQIMNYVPRTMMLLSFGQEQDQDPSTELGISDTVNAVLSSWLHCSKNCQPHTKTEKRFSF